ncbi:MAG: hypothetical protein C0608_01040 [Deltaproteobacteria bacterium]|nr:MAG: hypothetical protein C0608_01040 [Deltaproteobacteria bacterium]
MHSDNGEFKILEELGLEYEPVAIKYLTKPPKDIPALETKSALCEMLKKAQGGEVFYAGLENHTCEAGPYVLGLKEIEEQFISGEFGAGLGVFKDPRAASRLYHYTPRISPGVLNYVAFAPLGKVTFEPDILIILAEIPQAEIILRAMSYESGEMWMSRYSSAIGCAWLFAQPYLSGEINYFTTGFGFGMRRRKLFPEGRQFIAVPFDRLPGLLKTLREMPWVPRPFEADGLEFVKKLRISLGLDDE